MTNDSLRQATNTIDSIALTDGYVAVLVGWFCYFFLIFHIFVLILDFMLFLPFVLGF